LVVDGSDGYKNGQQIAAYIEGANNGHWDPDILSAAVRFLQNNIIGLGVATEEQKKNREEKAKAAAAKQRAEQIDANNKAVLANWLRNECPTGLLVNGTLYPSTLDKIIAYLDKNHSNNSGEMMLTPAMLSAAVTTLSNSLDWFSSKPEDHVLRNQPAPPSREEVLRSRLSDKALQDAGMKPRRLRGHENDNKLKDPSKEIQAFTRRELERRGVRDPFQERLESLCVMGFGRVDAGKTAQVRAIRVMKDGQVDWEASFRKADQLATQFENQKNRRANG
jgi:hypothetical protein